MRVSMLRYHRREPVSGRPLEFLPARTWGTRALALLLAFPLMLELAASTARWPTRALTLLLLALSLLRPPLGVLVLAGLLPLAPIAGLGFDRGSHLAGVLVVPVLLGAYLRASDDITPAVRWPALIVFGVLALLSTGPAPWQAWFGQSLSSF